MRKIEIDLTADELTPKYHFVGFEGEHNATLLTVILPGRMRLYGEIQYRFLFETARGEAVFSAPMLLQEDGSLSVPLAKTLMVSPLLKAYVGCYGTENGETVLVAKTPQMLLGVQKSISEDQEEMCVNGGCVPGLVIEETVLAESRNPVESGAIYRCLAEKLGREELLSSVGSEKEASFRVPVSEKAVASALAEKIGRSELKSEISTEPSSEVPVSEKAVVTALGEKISRSELKSGISTEPSSRVPASERAVAHALENFMKKEDYLVDSALLATSRNPVENRAVAKGVSGALKGNVSGNSIRIDDASGLEHEMEVKIQSRNLIPYPYQTATTTIKGVKYTVDDTGAVVLSGMHDDAATDPAAVFYLTGKFPVKAGTTYTLSGCPDGGSWGTYCLLLQTEDYNNTIAVEYGDKANGVAFTSKTDQYGRLCIVSWKGISFDDLVFHPQLEVGSGATSYTPYVDVSGMTVQKYGKNLLSYPYLSTTVSKNGITFTDNADGSVTVSGTATADAVFSLASHTVKANTDYFLSGCPSGGSKSSYYLHFRGFNFDTGSGVLLKNNKDFTNSAEIVIKSGTTVSNLVFKPQLELGSSATRYEMGISATAYTADKEGNVSGVVAGSNGITLVSKNGTLLSVTYNKDINKAFEEIQNAIISLGGNV